MKVEHQPDRNMKQKSPQDLLGSRNSLSNIAISCQKWDVFKYPTETSPKPESNKPSYTILKHGKNDQINPIHQPVQLHFWMTFEVKLISVEIEDKEHGLVGTRTFEMPEKWHEMPPTDIK